MSNVYRRCVDGPSKGQVYFLPEGKATGFLFKRGRMGRYIPVGTDQLRFEYWRRCTDDETNHLRKEDDNS